MSSVCREPSLVASVCRALASGGDGWPRPEGLLSPRASVITNSGLVDIHPSKSRPSCPKACRSQAQNRFLFRKTSRRGGVAKTSSLIGSD